MLEVDNDNSNVRESECVSFDVDIFALGEPDAMWAVECWKCGRSATARSIHDAVREVEEGHVRDGRYAHVLNIELMIPE